ncbi:hypothetical protein N7537_010506, partial [Penicillium hordei]
MSTKIYKVLMLHGHGQSADIFKPKTRYVRNVLRTLSNEMDFEFHHLSGVLSAYPDDSDLKDQRVWGYDEPENDKINGLEKSIEHILDALDQDGPFIGIVGFSSGAAMTAIVASILEKRTPICGVSWKRRHPQLRFAICLSGFKLKNKSYEAFYSPKIITPMFHAVGELDATVSPTQTRNLARCCFSPWFYEFFGGHYVPQSKDFLGFSQSLKSFLTAALGLSERVQESWVDIDIVDEKLERKAPFLP